MRQKGGAVSMGAGAVFLIRMGLGVLFAFVMVKLFYPRRGMLAVVGFTVFLVGMAYLLAHLREKREQEGRGHK
jgi:membrane protein implicated in regulation of membrane protease activity